MLEGGVSKDSKRRSGVKMEEEKEKWVLEADEAETWPRRRGLR
jgi:hypothetical protein